MKYSREDITVGFEFTNTSNTKYRVVSLSPKSDQCALFNITLAKNANMNYHMSQFIAELNKGNFKVKTEDYEVF